MSGRRLRLGDAGERYAERKLVASGWRIIDRKWRGESGEIDLVAEDADFIVFVEVKTRRGISHGAAEEAVDELKCQRLIRLGLEYIDQHSELGDRYWRVDLVAITLDRAGRIARYNHLENACLDE